MHKPYIGLFFVVFCALSFGYTQKTKVHLHVNIQVIKVLSLQYKKHFSHKWENATDLKNLKLEIAPSQYDFNIKTTCGDTIITNQKVVARADQHFYYKIKPNPTYDCDEDGVPNAKDQEMDSPKGVAVDADGRVLDSDGDGVKDYMDSDPHTPPRPVCSHCYDNPNIPPRKKKE